MSKKGRKLAASIVAGGAVLALFTAAFLSAEKPSQAGKRLASGPAPAFAARDVVNDRLVSSNVFKQGKNTLLFFSEGMMCQACIEQITAIEKASGELEKRRLRLISITPDAPDALRQAASHYGVSTPLLSDESLRMSSDYDMLGLGMHGNSPGHSFILIDDEGEIRWRRDYTTMYVEPEELLAELPKLE